MGDVACAAAARRRRPLLPGHRTVAPRRLAALLVLTAVLSLLGAEPATASGPAVRAPAAAAASGPWTWPLDGPRSVVRPFAPGATRYSAGHYGADLGGPAGHPVRAVGAGRVSYAGLLAGRGVVVVDHGGLRTTYEPVEVQVRLGQVVRGGQPLGRLSSGHPCPRTCLHLGLRRGDTYLDPLRLFGGPVRLLPLSGRPGGARHAVPVVGRRAVARLRGAGAAGRAGTGVGTPHTPPAQDPHREPAEAAPSGSLRQSAPATAPPDLTPASRARPVAARTGLVEQAPRAALALLALVVGLVLVRGSGPRTPAGGASGARPVLGAPLPADPLVVPTTLRTPDASVPRPAAGAPGPAAGGQDLVGRAPTGSDLVGDEPAAAVVLLDVERRRRRTG